MGISMITALEIYTNANDLEISVRQNKIGEKYALFISRGPGHDFKMLFSSSPFAATLEEIIKGVEEILQNIQTTMAKNFDDKNIIISEHLQANDEKIDQAKILNNELIQTIVKELKQYQVAITYCKNNSS